VSVASITVQSDGNQAATIRIFVSAITAVGADD
jgi:hypothetical protein